MDRSLKLRDVCGTFICSIICLGIMTTGLTHAVSMKFEKVTSI